MDLRLADLKGMDLKLIEWKAPLNRYNKDIKRNLYLYGGVILEYN